MTTMEQNWELFGETVGMKQEQVRLLREFRRLLYESRGEPGASIEDMAVQMSGVFSVEECEAFILALARENIKND